MLQIYSKTTMILRMISTLFDLVATCRSRLPLQHVLQSISHCTYCTAKGGLNHQEYTNTTVEICQHSNAKK